MLKIWDKIIRLFGKKEMKIEQTLKNWFDETCNHLEKHFQQHSQKTKLEDTVNASIAVVQNYLWSILKLLDKNQVDQHILPAMALLRCLYQLTSRITWILIGSTDSERCDRLKRLEKSSLEDQKGLTEKILEVFENDKRHDTRDVLNEHKKDLGAMKERIDYLDSCGTQNMPKPLEVLKEAFEGVYGQPREGPDVSKTTPLAAWPRLHKAVHPDYLVLESTIFNSEGSVLYDGDVNENIDDLRYECCVCVHRFLKEVYEFYKFRDFDKIDNDFRRLRNAIVSRRILPLCPLWQKCKIENVT